MVLEFVVFPPDWRRFHEGAVIFFEILLEVGGRNPEFSMANKVKDKWLA